MGSSSLILPPYTDFNRTARLGTAISVITQPLEKTGYAGNGG